MDIQLEEEFKPVVITLQTKEEVDLFYELLRHGSRKRQGHLKEFSNEMTELFKNKANIT